MNGEQLARMFHDIYETLAPRYGYETRKETRKFKRSSPNGQLMIAVCIEVLAVLERENQSVGNQERKLLREVFRAADSPLSEANDSLEWYRALQVPLAKYRAWQRRQEKKVIRRPVGRKGRGV